MSNSKGRLIILSAPSGTGKGAVIHEIRSKKPSLALSISVTTRKPRTGEVHGKDYYFVSKERFQEMISEDEFLEYAEYVGEYYGTPKKPVMDLLEKNIDVLLELEVLGAKQVMSIEPNALTVFIRPPNMQELERRLTKRGTDSEDMRAERLKKAMQEMQEEQHYRYIVVNDDITKTADKILDIIKNRED